MKMTQLRKILNALYLDYPETAAPKSFLTIVVNDHVIAAGSAEQLKNHPEVDKDWIVVSITPNTNLKNTLQYMNTPTYNLSKIIEVM